MHKCKQDGQTKCGDATGVPGAAAIKTECVGNEPFFIHFFPAETRGHGKGKAVLKKT